MGNIFKVSSTLPSQKIVLKTSKVESWIDDLRTEKNTQIDVNIEVMKSILGLDDDESRQLIRKFGRTLEKPIISKFHLLSGLTMLSLGSNEDKIRCIFNLFDLSNSRRYTHDEFAIAVFATLFATTNLCDILLDMKTIQKHIDELKDNDSIDIESFKEWCMKEIERLPKIVRRQESVEMIPLPIPTDTTLPMSDNPRAQNFLAKLPSIDTSSSEFSIEKLRLLITEGRALASSMCPHTKL